MERRLQAEVDTAYAGYLKMQVAEALEYAKTTGDKAYAGYLKMQVAEAFQYAKATGDTHAAQGFAREVRAVLAKYNGR